MALTDSWRQSVIRFIEGDFFRFVLVGGINWILTFGIYAMMLLILPYSVSYSIAYLAGIFISYYLNTRFVFKSNFSIRKAVKYPMVYLLQYIAGLVALYAMVDILHVNKLIASPLTIIITIPLTFAMSRWVIKERHLTLVKSQVDES